MSFFGDDEVVEYVDVDDFAYFNDAVGKGAVCRGGREVAAGVVVYEYELEGEFVNGHAEHIGWVGGYAVLAAEADEFYKENLIGIVEAHYPKVFLAAAEFIFAAEYLLHGGGDAVGAGDGGFFLCFGKFDGHAEKM